MPNTPERILYKLYPQLQGKSVFVVDSGQGKRNFVIELEEHLTKMQSMRVEKFTELYFKGNLLEIIKHHNIDVAIFHVADIIDEQNVLEAHQAGKKIIVLERENTDDYLAGIYQNLRNVGISSTQKLGNEFEMTKKITDLLAKQFSVTSGSEPEVFTSPSQT